MNYESLRVVDLKQILRDKGLKVSGRKAELVSRLTSVASVTNSNALDEPFDDNVSKGRLKCLMTQLPKNQRIRGIPHTLELAYDGWMKLNGPEQLVLDQFINQLKMERQAFMMKDAEKKMRAMINEAVRSQNKTTKYNYYETALRFAKLAGDIEIQIVLPSIMRRIKK